MKRYFVAALVASFLLSPVGSSSFAAGSHSDPEGITMNFHQVDIPVLAKFISEITGKNFIIDESVRGKVDIISPTKVTPDEAYAMFQSALQIKGFTTQQVGKVIKIVPSREVRTSALLSQTSDRNGDEFVTRMVRLKNVDAESVVNVVQPMITHDGLISAFPQDNTLIITDNAANIDRMLDIIGSLDVQGVQSDVKVIPLKLAFATDLSPEVEAIMNARNGVVSAGAAPVATRPGMPVPAPSTSGTSSGFKVLPDERTNSLIVLAGPVQMREIEEIVAKLDIQPPNATSRIHVYHLKNAEASEVVMVLSNLINGGGGGTGTLSPSTGRNSLGRGSATGSINSGFGGGFAGAGGGGGFGGGMGGIGSSSGFGGGFGGGGFGGGGLGSSSGFGGGMGGGGFGGMGGGGGMGNSSGNRPAVSASSGKTNDFSNPVSITADPATNAMVVSASPQDWQTLKQIIDELDVPRVQVFVQAIIVEISAERQHEIGVNFLASTSISASTLGIGSLNFGNLQSALGNPLGLSGLGLGLASGAQCTIPAAVSAATGSTTTSTSTVPCDIALMTALEVDTHSNVLSAPTLLTADNEEAMIVIGQNLPFVGSASANSGLPGQIFNSVERQNVGISLDIVPQVSEGDYVKMDLYEEVSNVVSGTENNTLGPTTTIRSASTTVLVQNHRTAVIGGLLSSQDSTTNQGIPFISNIPVLGNLFSDKSHDRQKDNLLVFLTPHVIRNRAQLRALALDERQQFIKSIGKKEVHDMEASQIQQLYKPNFSISVPPEVELNSSGGSFAAPAPSAGPLAAPPVGSGETPFNTEEIGPSSMKSTPKPAAGGPSVSAADSATTVASAGAAPSSAGADPEDHDTAPASVH